MPRSEKTEAAQTIVNEASAALNLDLVEMPSEHPETERQFPRPWRAVKLEESFRIEDATGFVVAHVYFAEPQRASVTKRMIESEARRVAHGIVRRINGEGESQVDAQGWFRDPD